MEFKVGDVVLIDLQNYVLGHQPRFYKGVVDSDSDHRYWPSGQVTVKFIDGMGTTISPSHLRLLSDLTELERLYYGV